MAHKTDVSIGLATIALSALFYWSTTFTSDVAGISDPLGPVAFPRAVTCLLFLFGCAQLFFSLRAKQGSAYFPDKASMRKTAAFALVVCLYITTVIWVDDVFLLLDLNKPGGTGFIVCTFAYLSIALVMCGRRNTVEILLVALLVPAAISMAFINFFQIMLP